MHSIAALMAEVAEQIYPTATLYVLATPIGNVGDISLRALHVLTIVDTIACEDTRKTGALLHRYGIQSSLIAAHEHNERAITAQIIFQLQQGERIALVSDAGTPTIADPGARIAAAVRASGLRIIPIPGAVAASAALSASGLVNDQFYFLGFLPSKPTQRDKILEQLRHHTATLIFYEAPHRIAATVDALLHLFGPARHIVLARELTKLFETIHSCPLAAAPAWIRQDTHHQRGEFVILIAGAPAEHARHDHEHILKTLLAELPLQQAVRLAAQMTGHKKNALYQQALNLQKTEK